MAEFDLESCGPCTAGLECERKKQHKKQISSCADKEHSDIKREQSVTQMS